MILAKGLVDVDFNFSSDMRMIEQAPSLILEALATVTVPFLSNEGFNFDTAYYLYLLTYSSAETIDSLAFVFILTGTIYDEHIPFLEASICLEKVILQYSS